MFPSRADFCPAPPWPTIQQRVLRWRQNLVAAPCHRPKTGVVLLSSREVEAATRGPDGQFRPELAIGGPSWPRDRAQSKSKHGWKLRASLTAPGDHSWPVSDGLSRFGPCPLSDILTPLSFICFWFFSNSPNRPAHSNRTAILSWEVWSV